MPGISRQTLLRVHSKHGIPPTIITSESFGVERYKSGNFYLNLWQRLLA